VFHVVDDVNFPVNESSHFNQQLLTTKQRLNAILINEELELKLNSYKIDFQLLGIELNFECR